MPKIFSEKEHSGTALEVVLLPKNQLQVRLWRASYLTGARETSNQLCSMDMIMDAKALSCDKYVKAGRFAGRERENASCLHKTWDKQREI